MKKTKGLSAVVTTLIIILLVLVAVGIIWVVVRNVVEQGTKQLSESRIDCPNEFKSIWDGSCKLKITEKVCEEEITHNSLSRAYTEKSNIMNKQINILAKVIEQRYSKGVVNEHLFVDFNNLSKEYYTIKDSETTCHEEEVDEIEYRIFSLVNITDLDFKKNMIGYCVKTGGILVQGEFCQRKKLKQDLTTEWLNENADECFFSERWWVPATEGIFDDLECSKYKIENYTITIK